MSDPIPPFSTNERVRVKTTDEIGTIITPGSFSSMVSFFATRRVIDNSQLEKVSELETVEHYVVVEGSHSGHCCFEASVLDTRVDNTIYAQAVCECFLLEDAKKIVAALNSLEK